MPVILHPETTTAGLTATPIRLGRNVKNNSPELLNSK